ncbi:hypothetical protein [Mycobacterium cookii]|uniref:hypothetical protein n=1 Tax=Mycobacterium cookii TaxID=1775 RepID=UPI0013D614D6|nr:hypothetical protein [Mycobacterium cookii]MCV7331424.1 hypothetical protein [Mycobacterium cookii]
MPRLESAQAFTVVLVESQILRVWHVPRFVAAIPAVIDQAMTQPGMVRFGFNISWWRLRFDTIAVFDTDTAAAEFVRGGAHGDLSRRLHHRLGRVRSRHGVLAGRDVPTTWADVPRARAAMTLTTTSTTSTTTESRPSTKFSHTQKGSTP